jgi:hypothetical protein
MGWDANKVIRFLNEIIRIADHSSNQYTWGSIFFEGLYRGCRNEGLGFREAQTILQFPYIPFVTESE